MPFKTLGRLTKDTVKTLTEPVAGFVQGITDVEVRCVQCDRVIFHRRPGQHDTWLCKNCSPKGRLEAV